MAHENVPLIRVYPLPFDHPVDRRIVTQRVSVLIAPCDLPDHRGTHKGQQIEMYRSELIGERHLFDRLFRIHRRHAAHMDLLSSQHTAKDVDPGPAVMVSADHHQFRGRSRCRQRLHKAVEQVHCFRGRDRLVIDIPRDHNGVRLIALCVLRDLVKYILLVLSEVPAHELEAYVQVR